MELRQNIQFIFLPDILFAKPIC